ncbi:MAG: radical SAM protein [Planctomycetota bacterium]
MGFNAREPLRVLLVKPCQPNTIPITTPPLGILCLASCLRKHFGTDVEVRVLDMFLTQRRAPEIESEMQQFRPHVVGISALNFEAEESGRIAHLINERYPETVVALGGPFAHGQQNLARITETGLYDWVFDGEADLAFPIAVERTFRGDGNLADIIGLTHRGGDGGYHTNVRLPGAPPLAGTVGDLDELPFPAWDLVDFDAYAKGINNNGNLKGKRYAPLFTSRGCPFLCTYCHDIFGKKFRGRSVENVLEEARLLRYKYGVDEFQIVDDIFNMNSRRMKEICRGLIPLKVNICFPNGLRGDILDEEGVDLLVKAGMYQVAVAIETVTPRLQDMVKKRLRLDQLLNAVKWMAERGVLVKGFFMLGFPTETMEEINATIDFAVKSDLAHAMFSLVTPQPGTPLYEEARKVNEKALEKVILSDYHSSTSWYGEAYGIDVHKIRASAYFRFYLSSPKRMWRIFRNTTWLDLARGFYYWIGRAFRRQWHLEEALPQTLPRKIYFPSELREISVREVAQPMEL